MLEKKDVETGEAIDTEDFASERQLVESLTSNFAAKLNEQGDVGAVDDVLEKLFLGTPLSTNELSLLLDLEDSEKIGKVFQLARERRESLYGRDVFIRAVIDMSNYCRRNCKFCGNAASNREVTRYRADPQAVFEQAQKAKELGIDLIHLAAGEDMKLRATVLADLITRINDELDCTVELALGVRPMEDYRTLFDAGAKRAIIKFETTVPDLFGDMKPKEDLQERLLLLLRLRSVGFKIGTGSILGFPGEKTGDIARDLAATLSLSPDMASTSVFIPNQESSFRDYSKGNEQMGLRYIALLRILMRDRRVSIPTNSTLGADGKYKALELGALELSLNMTPKDDDGQYSLYGGSRRFKAGLDDLKENTCRAGFVIKPFSEMQF